MLCTNYPPKFILHRATRRLRERTVFRIVAAIVLITVSTTGCDAGQKREVEVESASAMDTGPVITDAMLRGDTDSAPRNCLFILIDTTHAKHMSAWGYERNTTPNLDLLAKNGVRFSRTTSQAPSTGASTWSFLMGRYPKPADNNNLVHLAPSERPLSQLFSESEFATFGFSENPYISKELGYSNGFDKFEWVPPFVHNLSGRHENATQELFEKAYDAIESSDKPWFTYTHVLRPHSPYLAPEPFGKLFMTDDMGDVASIDLENDILHGTMEEFNHDFSPESYMRASYDGNLAYVDHLVGRFLERLANLGVLKETVVVIASDHGEEFLQHGSYSHGIRLYDELLHVPLIVWAPSITGVERNVVDVPVAMVDLHPTLVELFSLDGSDGTDGTSLMPFLRGESRPRVENIFAQNVAGFRVSVESDNVKMIASLQLQSREITNIEVFNLEEDPGELENLWSPERPFDDLRRRLEDYISKWPENPKLSDGALTQEQKDQLEAIGYIQ